MNSVSFLVLLMALAMSIWPGDPIIAQEDEVVVQGQIINGTKNGMSVANVTVVLHSDMGTFHNDVETITDMAGKFKFDGIITDPNIVYGISINYKRVLYGMDIDLAARPLDQVLIMVYDTSDRDHLISASGASILFSSVHKERHMVTVLEITTIVNDSDHTYVPGLDPMNLIRFGLPPGAQNLQVDASLLSADYAQVDKGFALLSGVPPGEHEIMFTYEFPYSGNATTFTKLLRYGAGHFRVLAPRDEFNLVAKKIGPVDMITIGENPYQLLEAKNVGKGTNISVELTQLPMPSLTDSLSFYLGQASYEYAAAGFLGLFMLVVISYGLFVKSKSRRYGVGTLVDTTSIDQEHISLMDIIKELKRGLNDGLITQEEYDRRRRLIEDRLLDLTRR